MCRNHSGFQSGAAPLCGKIAVIPVWFRRRYGIPGFTLSKILPPETEQPFCQMKGTQLVVVDIAIDDLLLSMTQAENLAHRQPGDQGNGCKYHQQPR